MFGEPGCCMTLRDLQRRLVSSVAYLVVASVILYSYADPYFCAASRIGQSRFLVSIKLALACTVWDFVAGWSSGAVFRQRRGLRAFVSALIAGAGFASIPFWIYRGYGVFMFENTPADVSCFFTEGSGRAFPFVVAPALAIATFVREWAIGKRDAGVQRLLR
jgi:hypothetical protein